jgi:hypothetical protein
MKATRKKASKKEFILKKAAQMFVKKVCSHFNA